MTAVLGATCNRSLTDAAAGLSTRRVIGTNITNTHVLTSSKKSRWRGAYTFGFASGKGKVRAHPRSQAVVNLRACLPSSTRIADILTSLVSRSMRTIIHQSLMVSLANQLRIESGRAGPCVRPAQVKPTDEEWINALTAVK